MTTQVKVEATHTHTVSHTQTHTPPRAAAVGSQPRLICAISPDSQERRPHLFKKCWDKLFFQGPAGQQWTR